MFFFRPQQNSRNSGFRAAEVAPRDRDRVPLEDPRPRKNRLRGRHPRRWNRGPAFCQGNNSGH